MRESFATPETVPFWQLSSYIDIAENAGLAAAGYRLQYFQLLAQPFFLAAMVLLAASVSLRFFRIGGVQKMVLGGVAAGFLLYVLAKVTGDLSKAELMSPHAGGERCPRSSAGSRLHHAAVPGGRVMALPASFHSTILRRRLHPAAQLHRALAALAARRAGSAHGPRIAQQRLIVDFPQRPKPTFQPGKRLDSRPGNVQEQMLVRADEINYDYTNERVSAVGNVQIYYGGSTLEADRVIYDQKTKRLHAEGNVRLTEADGKVTYGEIIDLSDDFRDGFVNSLRLDAPRADPRFAAAAPNASSGNFTVFQSGVYTACEPCKDDPRKPPKWQVKAARIIHDEGEKMMYFEDARLEFFGVPLAYMPYFSTPDPTVKRKTGFLIPTMSLEHRSTATRVATPYYWALAPDYDFDLHADAHHQAGPAGAGRMAPRLVDGSYTVRASGIWQYIVV